MIPAGRLLRFWGVPVQVGQMAMVLLRFDHDGLDLGGMGIYVCHI